MGKALRFTDGVDGEGVGDADDAERGTGGDDDAVAGLGELVFGTDAIDEEGEVIEVAGDVGLEGCDAIVECHAAHGGWRRWRVR